MISLSLRTEWLRLDLKTIRFINIIESIASMMTTISISNEMKEKIRNLGRAGDTYEDIIQKMYDLTRKNLLLKYLYDESDSVTPDEAISEARKRWPKSS